MVLLGSSARTAPPWSHVSTGRAAARRGAVLLPAALAAGLTLPFLRASPLWADEVDSASAAVRPLGALLRLLHHQDAPLAAYYLLLHAWVRLVGVSSWSLRLPSALAVIVAVGLTAELGCRLAGPVGGLLAGGLLASNPFVLAFGIDARPYAFALAAGVAAALVLVGAPERPGPGRRLSYAVLVVVGVLAHLFFLLLLPAHLLGLRLAHRPVRPWVLPAVAAVLVTAPVLVLSAGQTGEVGYLHRPGPLSLPGWFQAMAGGQAWLSVPAALLLLLAMRQGVLRAHPLLASWLLLPGPVLLLASLVHPLYLGRYVVESAPALSLLLMLALVRLGRRTLAAGLAGALLLVAVLTSVVSQSTTFRYENLRAAAETVLARSTGADGVVFLPISVRTAVGFYLSRVDPGSPRPIDLLAAPGGSETAVGNFGGQVLPPGPAVQRLLSRRVIWLVTYAGRSAGQGATAAAVFAALERCYRPGQAHHYGLVVVRREVASGHCGPVAVGSRG